MLSRSFFGVDKDGNLLLVAAGQGKDFGQGLSLRDGAWLLKDLGAVEAYVLDGGPSTTIYARGVEHARTDGRKIWAYLAIEQPN